MGTCLSACAQASKASVRPARSGLCSRVDGLHLLQLLMPRGILSLAVV